MTHSTEITGQVVLPDGSSAHWQSESSAPAPKRIIVADDTLSADAAYRLACAGTAILYRGDFQNARQLLQALARRVDKKSPKSLKAQSVSLSAKDGFNRHRLAMAQRSQILASLLIPVNADYSVSLRRAPDVKQACREAYGEGKTDFVVSLRELQGLIGAHEWRKKGVEIPALGERIHPHYGVFSPARGEYVDLVAQAPLPHNLALAVDIGVGTGVLSAVLAKRGVKRILATDMDDRALACAQDNLHRLGYLGKNKPIELLKTDLFPALAQYGQADLIVCNPPWLPAKPSSRIEYAIYDPESRMLRGFLAGVSAHLVRSGEAWLILSDLAEHLELRSREQLLGWITDAGLKVIARLDAKPSHKKVFDETDPLHAARSKEVTSLWRLGLI